MPLRCKVDFASANDAVELVHLRNDAAQRLTELFGPGIWSHQISEKSIHNGLKSSKILTARWRGRIVGTLRLGTKKPWAIDPAYFTGVPRPIYLVDMAVLPAKQRQGVGRLLLAHALAWAWKWPGDAVRLDAFDADAGAGDFYLKCGFRPRGRIVYRETPLLYFEMLREN